MTILCFDHLGQPTSLDAIRQTYGPLVIQAARPPAGYTGLVWRLAQIHERRNTYAAIETTALDTQGRPAAVRFAWYWPDAPDNPNAGPAAGVPEGMHPNRAVTDTTKDNGKVAFPMGPGAFYTPPDRGPHALWVAGRDTHSDLIWGLGMLVLTNHDHLDLVYRAEEITPEPQPPAEWDRLFRKLDKIIAILDRSQEPRQTPPDRLEGGGAP